jgi:hypothetical protein
MTLDDFWADVAGKAIGTILAAGCIGCREPLARNAGRLCKRLALALEKAGDWLVEKGGTLLFPGIGQLAL